MVNSAFVGNQCYRSGPDLGGAAIRVLGQWRNRPVYITRDTFRGGRCSNGSALSSIGVSWQVYDSVMTGNKAIGYGANPPNRGTAGGGSGGAIFFVSDNNTGTLTIEYSTLRKNPSGVFWTRPYPGIYFHSAGAPKIIHSTLG